MTDWKALAEPFADAEIKQRPGRAGMTFSYVDARTVAQRLDDVLTPEGWDFTSAVIPGTDVVHGKLVIGANIREDYGYPNSDSDDEPIKSASSDALKRCAVLFGVGRHLYGDNKPAQRRPSNIPQSPGRVSSTRPERSLTSVPEPDDGTPAEPEWLQKMPGGATTASHAEADNSECPIHNVAWLGSWGDLWHKTDDGKYCRHPENTRQEGRQGARR